MYNLKISTAAYKKRIKKLNIFLLYSLHSIKLNKLKWLALTLSQCPFSFSRKNKTISLRYYRTALRVFLADSVFSTKMQHFTDSRGKANLLGQLPWKLNWSQNGGSFYYSNKLSQLKTNNS